MRKKTLKPFETETERFLVCINQVVDIKQRKTLLNTIRARTKKISETEKYEKVGDLSGFGRMSRK